MLIHAQFAHDEWQLVLRINIQKCTWFSDDFCFMTQYIHERSSLKKWCNVSRLETERRKTVEFDSTSWNLRYCFGFLLLVSKHVRRNWNQKKTIRKMTTVFSVNNDHTILENSIYDALSIHNVPRLTWLGLNFKNKFYHNKNDLHEKWENVFAFETGISSAASKSVLRILLKP